MSNNKREETPLELLDAIEDSITRCKQCVRSNDYMTATEWIMYVKEMAQIVAIQTVMLSGSTKKKRDDDVCDHDWQYAVSCEQCTKCGETR